MAQYTEKYLAKAICYVATHRKTGKRYVGMTCRSLDERMNEHTRNAAGGRTNGPFPAALRCEPEAFNWQVVAEGEERVIKLLEAALIAAWGTAELGGLNAVGGLSEPPVRDLNYDLFAEKMDRNVRLLDMFNDLEAIVCYVEEHSATVGGYSDTIKDLANRLLSAVSHGED